MSFPFILSKFCTWQHTRPNEAINKGHFPYTYIVPSKRWSAANHLLNLLYVKIWPKFSLYSFISRFGMMWVISGVLDLFSPYFHLPFFLFRFFYHISRWHDFQDERTHSGSCANVASLFYFANLEELNGSSALKMVPINAETKNLSHAADPFRKKRVEVESEHFF